MSLKKNISIKSGIELHVLKFEKVSMRGWWSYVGKKKKTKICLLENL